MKWITTSRDVYYGHRLKTDCSECTCVCVCKYVCVHAYVCVQMCLCVHERLALEIIS